MDLGYKLPSLQLGARERGFHQALPACKPIEIVIAAPASRSRLVRSFDCIAIFFLIGMRSVATVRMLT